MKLALIATALLTVGLNVSAQESDHLRPLLDQPLLSTNVPVEMQGNGPSCYLRINSALNNLKEGQIVRWAYSDHQGWTVSSLTTDVHYSSCSPTSLACASTAAKGDQLEAGKSYYFAAQIVDFSDPVQKTLWSNEVECRVPHEASNR